MKISSNYYDYYSQMYQLNSVSNENVSNEDSNSSQDETEAISSTKKRNFIPDENATLMDLNNSGRMLMNSLKMSGDGSSEMSENKEKVRTDMEAIKTADIDNMSSDDVKNTLTQLKTDLQSILKSDKESSDISELDIDNLSESDMRDILKVVQEKANSIPDVNQEVKVSNAFSKLKEDMDSVKTLDIDNMASDDVKNTLTKLITDMESIPSPYGRQSRAQKTDIDNMSESDMRDMLKKIQEQANIMPMMGIIDPSQVPNGVEGNETSSINSGIDT